MSTYGYLAHHGIKGQKWGIRRYQNPDGSLTAEGQRRYGVYERHEQVKNKFNSMANQLNKDRKLLKDKKFMEEYNKAGSDWESVIKSYSKDKDYRKSIKVGKQLMSKIGSKITSQTLSGEPSKSIENKGIGFYK